MKARMIFALVAFLAFTMKANAMSYEQARDQALFLTDKMAYELNLTEDQYEAAYEINLDYLLSVNHQDDLYGIYWERRNLDLSYILLDWQYQNYLAASYFYRPLYWEAGFWHFGIYRVYPHRSYFYFGRPDFYWHYRGAHSWHMNGGRSWYHGRDWGTAHRRGTNHHGFGMRNGYDRGDWNNRSGNYVHREGGRGLERTNRDFGRGQGAGNNRHDNVGTRGNSGNANSGRGSFGGNRNNDMYSRGTTRHNNESNGVRQSETGGTRRGNIGSSRSGSYGVNQRGSSEVQRQRSNGSNSSGFGTRPSSTRSTVAPSTNRSSGHSGGYSAPNRTFEPQRNSGVQRSAAPSRSVSAPSRSVSAPSHSVSTPSRGSSSGGFSGGSHGGSHSGGGHSSSRGGGGFGGRR